MRFPGLHIYPIAQVLLLCLSIHNDTALAAPTTTTVNTTTVVVTSYAPTSTPADSYTSDTLFEETILNVTNEYRVGHNATALTWNDTLAEYADYWAKKCLWEHSVRMHLPSLLLSPSANSMQRVYSGYSGILLISDIFH